VLEHLGVKKVCIKRMKAQKSILSLGSSTQPWLSQQLKEHVGLSTAAHTCNPITWEAKAGELQV
jgi:hypothetical protein